MDEFPVEAVEPEPWETFVIENNLISIFGLAHRYIGNDIRRGEGTKVPRGFWLHGLDDLDSGHNIVKGNLVLFCNLRIVLFFYIRHIMQDNLLCKAPLEA